MLDMRLRLPELMAAHPELGTAYAIAKASRGAISMTNAHHLVKSRGAVERVAMRTLDALCDIFGVAPSELLERETKRRK